jgi:pimeloyl-ACP methyl ester carboxylesterase
MALLDRGDAQIWWEADGTGPPVLLIMGLGSPSDMWFRVAPVLTPRYRTIRFDNRGVGRTGVPPGPYSIELMAADAAAVLDAAGGSSAHVIGASLGGLIAQELALTHPQTVRSLVLTSTDPGCPDMVETDAHRRIDVGVEPPPPEVLIPLLHAPTTPRERIEESLKVLLQHPASPEGLYNQIAAMRSYAGTYSRLGQINQPTLVLHGTADRLVDPRNAELLARRIPSARLELLEGAGHSLVTDQPERYSELIIRFLDRISTGDPTSET